MGTPAIGDLLFWSFLSGDGVEMVGTGGASGSDAQSKWDHPLRSVAKMGVRVCSALACENLSWAQGWQTKCIFITVTGNFPTGGSIPLHYLWWGQGWSLGLEAMAAVCKVSCRHFLHTTGLPPSIRLARALYQHYQVLYKDSPYFFPWSQEWVS